MNAEVPIRPLAEDIAQELCFIDEPSSSAQLPAVPPRKEAAADIDDTWYLTKHARKRMARRSIPAEAVALALSIGRVIHCRGAQIFVLGRKETMHLGDDIAGYEGIQVVCVGATIVTVYRNRNFRGLRGKQRTRKYSKQQRTSNVSA